MRRRIRWAAAAAAGLAVAVAGVVPGVAGDSGGDPGPAGEVEKARAAISAVRVPALSTDQTAGKVAVTHVASRPGATGGHVSRDGKRLYVGAYGTGFRIFDVKDPANPRELGAYLPGGRADAVPDAAEIGGRHIVAFGGTRRVTRTDARTDITEFVDATDPANPKLLWKFVGPEDGESHNSDVVDERALWLPSGGSGTNGLRIYDLKPLLGGTAKAPANLFRGDPVALWAASPHRRNRPVGPAFTHVHDVTVYVDHPVGGTRRDIALLAEGGSYLNDAGNTGSVFVVDITNPRKPVVLNRWLHELADGHHPIRYHHEAQLLDGDRSVMIVTDEDLHNGCRAGGATMVRLSDDLTGAEELSEWFIGDEDAPVAPVCSTHVFSSVGNLVFIGSYNAGLQVLDLSDPTVPTKAASFVPTGANTWGALAWGTRGETFVYLGDFGARGLDVLKVDGNGGTATTGSKRKL